MRFFSFLFTLFFASKILSLLVFVAIGIGLFFFFSDYNFIADSTENVRTIMENNSGETTSWLSEYIKKIKELF